MFMLVYNAGNRIVTASMPWVTAANTFQREPQASENAMRFNCFDRELRTTGGITAMITKNGAY